MLLEKSHFADALYLWEASVRATHHFLAEGDVEFYKPYVKQYIESTPIHFLMSPHRRLMAIIGVSNNMVDMLFVHPEHFGNGIGRKLLQFAISNLEAERVDVNEQNEGAMAFYVKNGFKAVGRSEVDGFGKPYPIINLSINKDTKINGHKSNCI